MAPYPQPDAQLSVDEITNEDLHCGGGAPYGCTLSATCLRSLQWLTDWYLRRYDVDSLHAHLLRARALGSLSQVEDEREQPTLFERSVRASAQADRATAHLDYPANLIQAYHSINSSGQSTPRSSCKSPSQFLPPGP